MAQYRQEHLALADSSIRARDITQFVDSGAGLYDGVCNTTLPTHNGILHIKMQGHTDETPPSRLYGDRGLREANHLKAPRRISSFHKETALERPAGMITGYTATNSPGKSAGGAITRVERGRSHNHPTCVSPVESPTRLFQMMPIGGNQMRDDDKLISLYENFIVPRIMPFATKYNLNLDADGRDIVIGLSVSHPALNHAIRALAGLSLAFNDQVHLPYAFHLYHEAVLASWAATSGIHSACSFYTFFLMYIFDVECQSRFQLPCDASASRRHLDHIFKAFHSEFLGQINNSLMRHLSWMILSHDAQTSLTGMNGAAPFVTACQSHGYLSSSLVQHTGTCGTHVDLLQQIQNVDLRLSQTFAELSRTAFIMRRAVDEGHLCTGDAQDQTMRLYTNLHCYWTKTCPQSLQAMEHTYTTDLMSGIGLQEITKTTFVLARLKYSAMVLYLHTSMYSGQHKHYEQFSAEIAPHFSRILTLTAEAIANKKVERYFPFAVLLVGIINRSKTERAVALRLYDAIDYGLVGQSCGYSRSLLQSMQQEQLRLELTWRLDEAEDWIRFERLGRLLPIVSHT